MKTIKVSFLKISLLFLSLSIFTNCSKNDDVNQSENAKTNAYLKSFYSKEFTLGKAVGTKFAKPSSVNAKSVEFEDAIITEVFVGNDTRARGYLITSKSTNELKYFIDVDRVDFKMTSVKVDINDTKVFDDINDLDKYTITNEFDFIKIAEDMNAGTTQYNKFWGWGEMWPGPCVGGVRSMFKTYYVLWIPVSTVPVPGEGGNLQEPCGEAVLGE